MRLRTILALFFVLLVVAAAVAGALLADGGPLRGGKVAVVAAENAYGDIALQIGRPHIRVTSILSDPSADPHLFEPGTRNGLAVAEARLVIQNGAGYDAFMTKLEAAAPSRGRVVVTIADVLGVRGRDANPHLWYDVPALPHIAGAIAAALERVDPAHAASYRSGLARFRAGLAPLRQEVARIRTAFPGRPVAATEPLPGYLVAAAGLRDLAPSAFTRALQSGTEPTPEAVAAMDALVRARRINALLVNSQAVSPITMRLEEAAHAAGVPVVPFTETLPPGRTFQQWQTDQTRALYEALAR